MEFQNYHRHDYYTNVVVPDSPVSPEDYAIRAKSLGHTILSCVQHGWAGRYIEHYELAKKYGLKFLFGAEVYFVKDRTEKDKTNAHIILLAKNENGRKSINRILSEANISGFYYRARIDTELLLSLPKNDVWVTTACVGGLWKYEDSDDLILKFFKHFGDNFFLEVQNHNTDSQKELNKRIINMSNEHGIKMIFGCDSHFIYPDQSPLRDDYLASKHVVYEDEDGWFMDYPDGIEAYDRFKRQGVLTAAQIVEAIDNTNILKTVEEYTSEIFQNNLKLPSLYPDCNQEEKNSILLNLIWEQWEQEKGEVPEDRWEEYETEINKELDIVIDTGMADYFLLDYEVVKKGKELGGHITLTGRGSAPSFYLSKLLGFTTIDRVSASVKLFPERFITKERILEAGSLPDIDFNLGNPEVFAQAQIDVMGDNHSYPMLAYGTLRPKAAWKLYARAKEVDFETANDVSVQIGDYETSLKYSDSPEDVSPYDYVDQKYHRMYDNSLQYLGVVSDYKIHPCAYLLYDNDISEEIGLVKIKNNLCCCMDGAWAEQNKFLKNDLLKVSVVELIYRVYKEIGVEPHPLPKLIEVCKDNDIVWQVYRNAWTMGINQVEQTSTKGRVAKYSPQNISELSAFVAAVRPGFKSNYKQFESRESFSYGIPSLDNLIQTEEFPQSYLIYQENSMQAMAYAGIPIAETYDIVKYIAKKRVDKVLGNKSRFISGMTNHVMESEGKSKTESKKIADMTWQIIEDSAHYSFNASHAYSTAGDSLYGAYLKSHYPLEFYKVFLDMLNEDGDKDRLVLAKTEAEEAYKVHFPPLKFGQSNSGFAFNKEKNEIISSISSIKGMNAKTVDNLISLAEREYTDFVDFLIHAAENKMVSKKFEDLILIDYFSKFGKNKKLYDFFMEFTQGENRYLKSHTKKTKEKRIPELVSKFDELKNEAIDVTNQIFNELDILGHVQALYPNISKRFIYVVKVNTKFSPRIQAYCLNNGEQKSLKIRMAVFENNLFYAGEILRIEKAQKKPSVTYEDGKYIESEDDFTWWIQKYRVVKPEELDYYINKEIK